MNLTGSRSGDSRADRCDVKFWRVPQLDNLELFHGSYAAHGFPCHMHDEYILGVMVRGVEALRVCGATHLAPAGSVLMINPGEWHANYALDEAGFAYRTLYPPVDLIRRVTSEIAGTDRDAPCLNQQPVARDETLGRLLLRLHLTLEHNASFLEQETCFVDAMAHLLSHYAAIRPTLPPPQREQHYIRRVRDYLDARYAENVSLADLGALTGVSPFHLLRMFRDAVGLPPHEYQTHIRVAQAKRLLRSGWTSGQAAAEVGFVDQSHLTRHFKRIVGLTPGQFSSGSKNVQAAMTRSPLK